MQRLAPQDIRWHGQSKFISWKRTNLCKKMEVFFQNYRGTPEKIQLFSWEFPYKPSIWGTPIFGNLHMNIYICIHITYTMYSLEDR